MRQRACFVFVLLLLLESSSAAGGSPANRTEPAPRPNIVFFLIDDLGFADCGFNAGKDIHTPHIDALAAGGSVLDAHYVQPVCSPTRAALMTGRYATHTGVYNVVRPHAKWGLPLNERTLASALRDAGYETAIAGKWHLGEFDRAYLPTSRGFEHQYGHYFGALDYFTHVRDGSHDWYRNDQELHEDGYSTELLAAEACRRITDRDPGRPLFLYVPFNAVHSPHQVPERYLEPYGHLMGNRRLVAGMLAAVDEAIGRIVAALDSAGLRDNTLIVYSADNGGPNPQAAHSNDPLRAGKGTLYEGGIRAAAFANWPGHIPAGIRIAEPVHIIDWYPTFVNLAGGSLEQPLRIDGVDILPVLTSNAKSPHTEILIPQSPTRAALRMGNWKLIRNLPDNSAAVEPETEKPPAKRNPRQKAKARIRSQESTELYDLEHDVSESSNLADSNNELVAKMQARLDELLNNAAAPGNSLAEE
jgi:arylsulfatase A-like enzyme